MCTYLLLPSTFHKIVENNKLCILQKIRTLPGPNLLYSAVSKVDYLRMKLKAKYTRKQNRTHHALQIKIKTKMQKKNVQHPGFDHDWSLKVVVQSNGQSVCNDPKNTIS